MEMDVSAYFQRIGITHRTDPTLEFLETLQESHILAIPFENLDVMTKTPIVLEITRIIEKIVRNKRGGFCFEQNGLFHSILMELGFTVWMSEASVYIDRQKQFGEMRNHMVLIVRLENDPNRDYLVDVGFGRTSRKPLPLDGSEITSIDGTFRVSKTDSNLHMVEYYADDDWIVQYKFRVNPIALVDFQKNCDWIQTSQDSMFTQVRMITLGTETGRIILEEDFVSIRKNDIIERMVLTPEKSFDYYYESLFP